jgi:hypothetical protein
MQTPSATTQPADSGSIRPTEKSSRLSNGFVPIIFVVIAIAAVQMRRRRGREQAMRDAPPMPRE